MGVLENHLAIIVSCAPSVKILALIIFPRLASSLSKVVSKVSPSASRSRSRASGGPRYSGTSDLESGNKNIRKADKLKLTPLSTPMPSPALVKGSAFGPTSPLSAMSPTTRAMSRASRNFAKWFKGEEGSRGLPSGDSEGRLVYTEDQHSTYDSKSVHLMSITKEGDEEGWDKGVNGDRGTDIRVEHTITVEEGSNRGSEENGLKDVEVVGRAA